MFDKKNKTKKRKNKNKNQHKKNQKNLGGPTTTGVKRF